MWWVGSMWYQNSYESVFRMWLKALPPLGRCQSLPSCDTEWILIISVVVLVNWWKTYVKRNKGSWNQQQIAWLWLALRSSVRRSERYLSVLPKWCQKLWDRLSEALRDILVWLLLFVWGVCQGIATALTEALPINYPFWYVALLNKLSWWFPNYYWPIHFTIKKCGAKPFATGFVLCWGIPIFTINLVVYALCQLIE